MNEKLQYATMLEIPVNTCSVTPMPTKKRRVKRKKVNPETVKEQLLDKINSQIEQEEQPPVDDALTAQIESEQTVEEEILKNDLVERQENSVNIYSKQSEKPKKRKGFSVIGVQLAVIGILIATIFLTNATYSDSGLNVFFRNVFGNTQTEVVDERNFDEFLPVIAMGDNQGVMLDGGIISFNGKGSVYAPCDGKVSAIQKDENGKFSIEIMHSNNFKSLLTGVEYAYVGLDDTVYANIPVGYLHADGATMCFTSGDGTLIDNYQIVDNAVVWAV